MDVAWNERSFLHTCFDKMNSFRAFLFHKQPLYSVHTSHYLLPQMGALTIILIVAGWLQTEESSVKRTISACRPH